jgi:hypothetical protein
LLVDLGVIDESSSHDIDRRIGFMNAVRNRLVHTGEPPSLKGLNEEQAMRYTTVIATGVVPEINIAAIGRVLGFKKGSIGSLSQNVRDLQHFFQQGTWRGWPLEAVEFEDWFYDVGEDAR